MLLERQTLWFSSYKNHGKSKLTKEERVHFSNVYFALRKIFSVCILSQCVENRTNFQNMNTFTYQKTLHYTLFKTVKILQCIPIIHLIKILGDSQNYMPPILVPSSTKRIATQVLVIAKLNGRKDFILRVFACDIIRPSMELPVQS